MDQTRLKKGKWFRNDWTGGQERLEKIDKDIEGSQYREYWNAERIEKITNMQKGSERKRARKN